MKKVLLTTTALVMTAGVAAADVTLGGSAAIKYGSWGTSGGSNQSWKSTTDLSVSMAGEASGIAYTASLGIDEHDEGDADADISGAISMSGSGLTFSFENGGTAFDSGEDGEDDGNLKIGYSAAGVTVTYVENTSNDANKLDLGYTAGDLTLGYSTNTTDDVNTLSASFTAGDIKVSLSGDDGKIGAATASAWSASAAYTMGASTITVATSQANVPSVSLTTSLNGISVTAKAKDNDNELALGYTTGAIGLSYAYDQGDSTVAGTTTDGDDAQTIMKITYDLGGIKLHGQSNNLSEVEIGASFTF